MCAVAISDMEAFQSIVLPIVETTALEYFSNLHLNNSKHVSKLLLRMAFQSCEYYIVVDSRRAVSPILKSGFYTIKIIKHTCI